LSHKNINTVRIVNRERKMQQKNPKKYKKKRKNNNINNTNTEHQQLAENHRKLTTTAEEAGCDPDALVGSWPLETWVASAQAENDGEGSGMALVDQ
jgi:hypothetical protein